jgi:outer membrane immunogenic protein
MKKRCTGFLAFVLTGVAAMASANAADLAVKAPVYKAPPMVVYPSWAGFYIGGHIGGAWGTTDVNAFDEDRNSFKNNSSGVIGGGTIGYNFQTGNFVYGVEADFGVLGLSHSAANPIDSTIISKTSSAFYMDATARLGYAFDKALLYAKGGYAFYDGPISITDTANPATSSVTGISGWTVGGGIEYKIAPAWSVKAEYQFFDFGNNGLNIVDSPVVTDHFDNKLTVQTVKAGVNYHF